MNNKINITKDGMYEGIWTSEEMDVLINQWID